MHSDEQGRVGSRLYSDEQGRVGSRLYSDEQGRVGSRLYSTLYSVPLSVIYNSAFLDGAESDTPSLEDEQPHQFPCMSPEDKAIAYPPHTHPPPTSTSTMSLHCYTFIHEAVGILPAGLRATLQALLQSPTPF